jgi:hypothetical protein
MAASHCCERHRRAHRLFPAGDAFFGSDLIREQCQGIVKAR